MRFGPRQLVLDGTAIHRFVGGTGMRNWVRRLASRLSPALGVILLVFVWWAVARSGLVRPILLPPPGEAWGALVKGIADGGLTQDCLVTLQRTVAAFLIAAVIAIPVGILLGANVAVYRSMEVVIDFFRSTPASAMFPLFLVVFGIGDGTKIAVGAFGAALVILFNVAYGVMNARRTRVMAARVMGASRRRVLVDVYFWESLPQTVVGLRNGVSLALVIVVVAEMFIGSADGLGHRLIEAQMMFEMPGMYATIFTAGMLGYGMNCIFLFAEQRWLHWGGK
jgi:NitT/TauT family transport system permease protein